MAIDCTLATVSDFAYADRATGKLYVLGVIRYILTRKVPATHPRLTVSFMLEDFTTNLSPDRTVMTELLIQSADGHDIIPPSPAQAIAFRPIGPASRAKSQATVTLELNGLVLPNFGDYAILLRRAGGDVFARAAFTVVQTPPKLPSSAE